MWRKGNPCALLMDTNWCSNYGKQYGNSSKIINRTAVWSSNSISMCTSKGKKSLSGRDICIPTLIAILFTIAETWIKLSVHQWINE